MVKKETIAIGTLLVAIVGLIPFSGIMELLITPTFKVDVNYYKDRNDVSYQNVKISNIGLSQAKNTMVTISTSYPLVLDYPQCAEGKILNDNSTTIKIHFERFSQNIECRLFFFSQYEYNISRVEVTADDAEGYTYSYGEETLNFGTRLAILSLSILVVVFLVMLFKKRQKSYISFNVGFPTELSLDLVKKYGQGFTEDDEDILRAIKRDKNTLEEIAIFTNLSEGDVQGRLEFMEEKEVLYDINGIWDIDDDSIKKKIPK